MPSLSKKAVVIIFSAVLTASIVYDFISLKKYFLGKDIEDAYVAAYPAVNLYHEYVLPITEYPGATTNHFYPLIQDDEDEKIVSVNAVAVINISQNPVTVIFPAIREFHNATTTFLDWNGLVLGGEGAYNTQYRITQNTADNNLIHTHASTLLAFIRIPLTNHVTLATMPGILEKIIIQPDSTAAGLQATPIQPLANCMNGDYEKIFIPCMNNLITAFGLVSDQYAPFVTALGHIGPPENIDPAMMNDASTESELMINQVLTDGISLVTQNMWIAYEDMFTLKPTTVQLQLNKAAFVKANFVAVPGNKMKYAIKRYNARGESINGRQHTYKLNFNPALLPHEISEWHFIVRDNNHILFHQQKRSIISFNNPMKREADGSINLYFSHEKPTDIPEENWLPIPEDLFEIVFMGRGLIANPDSDDFNYLNELIVIQ